MRKCVYFFTILLISVIGCNESDDSSTGNYNTDVTTLQTSLNAINALANQSTCGDNFTCKYIGLGEKACGGNKSYLLYSTSIDTDELEAMVIAYNKFEKEFNIKWEIISDCSLILPPTGTSCENGKCVAVYEN